MILTKAILVDAAERGESFLELAQRLGVTRNVVAGAAYRAGVTFPPKSRSVPHTAEHEANRIAAVRAVWADPQKRADLIAKQTATRARQRGKRADA